MTLYQKILYGCIVILSAVLSSYTPINDPRKSIDKGIHPGDDTGWMAGTARCIITPVTDVWLAGFGVKRPAEGKLHDIWVKVLALKTKAGKRAVMVTTDHQGMSRVIYESLYKKIQQQFQLSRSEFMLTFSHNHSGPRLRCDLEDYYPADDQQQKLVDEYSDRMEEQIIGAVDEALKNLQPVRIYKGEGQCTFAVNRRDNAEATVPAMLAEGKQLKGATDHYVPVLSVKDTSGKLMAILFGYACHPTTLYGNLWSGDYPGFAQINIEQHYPGVTALFFNTCGGDQNPLPRGTVALCEKYGKMLSDAVTTVIGGPMQPVSSKLQTAFQFVTLDYETRVTEEKLRPITTGTNAIHARWGRRMLQLIDKGIRFPAAYPYYPVQAWQLGKELLFIATGGETVVDYSLRFKRTFGAGATWVFGYTNTMVAYIPSRRVWEEGGYEGGPHLDEYGHPAWRWAGNVEDRISKGVHQVVKQVRK